MPRTLMLAALIMAGFAGPAGSRDNTGTTAPRPEPRPTAIRNCTAWGPDHTGVCAEIRHCAERQCIEGGTGKTWCFTVTSTECRKKRADTKMR